jgi:hypothetical protein
VPDQGLRIAAIRPISLAGYCGPQKVAGGVMVYLGGPRKSWSGRAKPLVLHDPPPGYRPPRLRMPLKARQRQAREDRALMRVTTVILILAVAATVVIIAAIIATHV